MPTEAGASGVEGRRGGGAAGSRRQRGSTAGLHTDGGTARHRDSRRRRCQVRLAAAAIGMGCGYPNCIPPASCNGQQSRPPWAAHKEPKPKHRGPPTGSPSCTASQAGLQATPTWATSRPSRPKTHNNPLSPYKICKQTPRLTYIYMF